MQLYWWELLAVFHHQDKFDDPRHCDSGDLMFLICHKTPRDHVFKGLCDLWVEALDGKLSPCHI